jgi:thiosulfate dehydrogenase
MPWVGVSGRFPQYRSRSAKVTIPQDRINDCFQRSLDGTALDTRGDNSRYITAYIS